MMQAKSRRPRFISPGRSPPAGSNAAPFGVTPDACTGGPTPGPNPPQNTTPGGGSTPPPTNIQKPNPLSTKGGAQDMGSDNTGGLTLEGCVNNDDCPTGEICMEGDCTVPGLSPLDEGIKQRMQKLGGIIKG